MSGNHECRYRKVSGQAPRRANGTGELRLALGLLIQNPTLALGSPNLKIWPFGS